MFALLGGIGAPPPPRARNDAVSQRNKAVDTLRIKEADRDALLENLDRESKNAGEQDHGRKHDRVQFKAKQITVTFIHPGGVETRCLVMARNISIAGVGFLHGGYLHNGSECIIELPTLFGETISIRGTVRACRHVSGNIHEIGIQFESEIDPYEFLEPGDAPSAGAAHAIDKSQISGSLLVIESSPADARLLQHHLSGSGVTVQVIETFEDANDTIASGAFDAIMLCDTALGPNGGADTVQGIRMQGFDGPIIAMTAESKSEWLATVRNCGCTDIVVKPYDPGKLFATLSQHLAGGVAGATSGKIHSELAKDPSTIELLESFLKDVDATIKDLHTKMQSGDTPAVRHGCLGLKGSGRGYGYPRLSDAAREVVDTIDKSTDTKDVQVALSCLEMVFQPPHRRAPYPLADPRPTAGSQSASAARPGRSASQRAAAQQTRR